MKVIMKVIFLDNDGVICLDNNWGGRAKKWKEYIRTIPSSLLLKDAPVEYRFDNFDKKAIKVLNSILKETNVEIVVSSDWRLSATLEEIGDYYESKGIIKRPIGFTRVFDDMNRENPGKYILEYDPFKRNELEQMRVFEIKDYLLNNKVTKWVAVDDLDLGYGLDNFVHTKRVSEGIKQLGIKEKIIDYLR